MKKKLGKINSGIVAVLLTIGAFVGGFAAFIFFDHLFVQKRTVPSEYIYDIEALSAIDPSQIVYEQVDNAIATELTNSQAIAVGNDGTIFVAGDRSILQIAPDGKRSSFELPDEPFSITVEDDSIVYAGLGNHIELFELDGKSVSVWEAPAENALLTGIAIGKEDVFAADAINKVVWRFDWQGKVVGSIGKKDPDQDIPGFVVPSPYFDVSIAEDGLLRISNPGLHTIEAFTFDGDREWVWGTASVDLEGFSGCCNPIAFAILPDGGFVTCEKGLVRVKVYTEEGEYAGVVAGPLQLNRTEPMRVCETVDQCQSKGLDVAADTAGKIYVLDLVRNEIRMFKKRN